MEVQVYEDELSPWFLAQGLTGQYLARQIHEPVRGPQEGVALFIRTSVFETLGTQAGAATAAGMPVQGPGPWCKVSGLVVMLGCRPGAPEAWVDHLSPALQHLGGPGCPAGCALV